jgi:hypothetical protein
MDPDIKQAIEELELLTNAPKSVKDMLPHERILADNIGRIALHLNLSDLELIAALPRILAFLVRQVAEKGGLL